MVQKRVHKAPAGFAIGPKNELITRKRAAEILSISTTELRSREKEGIYPFEVDPETGWHWYNENTLRKIAGLPPKEERAKHIPRAVRVQGLKAEVQARLVEPDPQVYDGETAARVFAELEKGQNAVQIVVSLKLHPEIVGEIRDSWMKLQGGVYFAKKDIDRVAELPLKGDVKLGSVDEFVQTLTASLAPTQCGKCKAKPARVCTACIEAAEENGMRHSPNKPIYGSGAKDM